MIAVTRIPTHRNDGSEVTSQELERILRQVRRKFHGYSLEGPNTGSWVASNGKVYEERSYRLEVIVPSHRVEEIRKQFMRIGKRLGQRAIFFEVREGGEIIELNEED